MSSFNAPLQLIDSEITFVRDYCIPALFTLYGRNATHFSGNFLSEKYMFMGLLKADHHWGDRLFYVLHH